MWRLCGVFLFLSFLGGQAWGTTTELLTDGGFENGLWSTSGNGTFSLDNTVVHGGNYSAKITDLNGSGMMTSNLIPVQEGQTYVIAGYAKAAGLDGDLDVHFSTFDSNQTFLGDITPSMSYTGTFDWQGGFQPFEFPEGTGIAYLQLCLGYMNATTGIIWFDDASLTAPEPVSIIMLALGILVFAKRRIF